MVERLPQKLKAALTAYNQRERWSEDLPIVLVSIHAALKQDLNCTAAQLVYGITLRLPGEFFSPVSTATTPQVTYVEELRLLFQDV